MAIVRLMIDWAEAYGWKCAFCGGEIDHSHCEVDPDYCDDSYLCCGKGHEMCANAYFMVRWSQHEKGANGDALTLSRWIDFEINKRYVSASLGDDALL